VGVLDRVRGARRSLPRRDPRPDRGGLVRRGSVRASRCNGRRRSLRAPARCTATSRSFRAPSCSRSGGSHPARPRSGRSSSRRRLGSCSPSCARRGDAGSGGSSASSRARSG
jgi:hypothetical protein